MSRATRIAVLGAGSWGTALAALLARHGHAVSLWGRDAEALAGIASTRINARYLPGIELPASLSTEADLERCVERSDLWLIVVPSHAFGEIIRRIAPMRSASTGLAWATKGFEPGSGRFLHQVVDDQIGAQTPRAIVTGPSFAKEVALGLPSAVTVHSEDESFATEVARLLHGPSFRAYTGTDIAGAELGGAMKNVLAVATGIADGMKLGLNARAGMITRGLNEMLRLNLCLGGKAETIMGLAGLGDLVLTCTGDLSRNRRLGLALGAGVPMAQAVREIGQVVESVQTAAEIDRLARRFGLDLPISSHVHAVLIGEITPEEGLRSLLAREQKPEFPPGVLGAWM